MRTTVISSVDLNNNVDDSHFETEESHAQNYSVQLTKLLTPIGVKNEVTQGHVILGESSIRRSQFLYQLGKIFK